MGTGPAAGSGATFEHQATEATVLVSVAHPDDESFGCGTVIADAAARGLRVVVCCASRGEEGQDASGRHVTGEELAAAREAELRAAAAELGVAEVEVLGFRDSGWDGECGPETLVGDPDGLRDAMVAAILRHRPAVVVTMDPTGSDGHRDHAAIGRATTEAFRAAVDWPASLYHWFLPRSLMQQWSREIAAQNPDSVYLETELGRADDDVTTVIDGTALRERRWRAIAVHESQASPYASVSADLAAAFVGRDHLVRIVPEWAGGPLESELHVPAQERVPTT